MPAKQDRPAVKPLRVNDLLFINEYLANGRNGTQAYMKIHPHAKPDSARAQAPEILAKPCVQAEIANRVQHEGGVTRAFVESSLLRYQAWADAKQDYLAGASICMDAARLAGFITEKREVKTVTDDESSRVRELVRTSMQPLTNQHNGN